LDIVGDPAWIRKRWQDSIGEVGGGLELTGAAALRNPFPLVMVPRLIRQQVVS
jgi:hypothetical protein